MKHDQQYGARELELFQALRERLDETEQPLDASLYSGVLDSARGQAHLRLVSEHELEAAPIALPGKLGRARVAVLGATLAVVASAAAAFVVWQTRHGSPSVVSAPRAAVPVAAAQVRSELVLAAGEVNVGALAAKVGQGPLGTGQHVATGHGRACVGVDPQIDVCLGQNSEIVLESLTERDVRVRVLNGTAVAALARRAEGHTFSLVSGDAVATARGTVFAVAPGEVGATAIVVMEGNVEVTRSDRSVALVPPHSRLELSQAVSKAAPALVGRNEEAQLLALVAPRALWQGKALGLLDVSKSGAWVEASLGDWGALPLPLEAFVPAGSQRLVLRDAVGIEVAADIDVVGGQTRRVDGSQLGPSVPKSMASASSPESAENLLDRARRELGRGGAKAALPLYQRLLATYPKSPEAFTVLVTVGQLELAQGAPSKALAAFDAYLKRGGALAQEAAAGKIRALRELGNSAAERAAIVDYLSRYPDGFEAPALRRRLEASP